MWRSSYILLVLMIIGLAACGEQKSAVKPKAHTRPVQNRNQESAGRPLPPPGQPLLGTRPSMPSQTIITTPQDYKVTTLASGLVIPWDIVFVSRNRIYITERPGRVRLIENGKLQTKPYAVIPVASDGEGGLMGMTLNPNYPNPRQVYLMYTYRKSGGLYNRVSRFTDTGNGLGSEKILVDGIRGRSYHNGGRIRFGPDGMLYIGTGDGGEPERAQNLSSLNGKILRMTPNGSVPKDNPFPDSFVYAYGLRNVQGLAWNPENGDLWATMHGPTGEFGLEARDEVFIIPKGGNCGWPRTLGVTNVRGVVPPVLYFPDLSVPPGGAVFYTGSLMPQLHNNFFITTLASEELLRVVLSGPRKITRIDRWFAIGPHQGKYGRLRTIVQGPDGALYVTTSNRDGRGSVRQGDDKILRITQK